MTQRKDRNVIIVLRGETTSKELPPRREQKSKVELLFPPEAFNELNDGRFSLTSQPVRCAEFDKDAVTFRIRDRSISSGLCCQITNAHCEAWDTATPALCKLCVRVFSPLFCFVFVFVFLPERVLWKLFLLTSNKEKIKQKRKKMRKKRNKTTFAHKKQAEDRFGLRITGFVASCVALARSGYLEQKRNFNTLLWILTNSMGRVCSTQCTRSGWQSAAIHGVFLSGFCLLIRCLRVWWFGRLAVVIFRKKIQTVLSGLTLLFSGKKKKREKEKLPQPATEQKTQKTLFLETNHSQATLFQSLRANHGLWENIHGRTHCTVGDGCLKYATSETKEARRPFLVLVPFRNKMFGKEPPKNQNAMIWELPASSHNFSQRICDLRFCLVLLCSIASSLGGDKKGRV